MYVYVYVYVCIYELYNITYIHRVRLAEGTTLRRGVSSRSAVRVITYQFSNLRFKQAQGPCSYFVRFK